MANTTSKTAPTALTNTNPAPQKSAPSPAPDPTPESETKLPPSRVVDEIPQTDRNGVWVQESKWFFDNPHKIKVYEGVSQTTASYLRGKFGLDAQARRTRKVDNGKGDGGKSTVVDLYVRFIPERQAEIKAAAKSKAGGKNKKSENASAASA